MKNRILKLCILCSTILGVAACSTDTSTSSYSINPSNSYTEDPDYLPISWGETKAHIYIKDEGPSEGYVRPDSEHVRHLSTGIEYGLNIYWVVGAGKPQTSDGQAPVMIGLYKKDSLTWTINDAITLTRVPDDEDKYDEIFTLSCNEKIEDTMKFYNKEDPENDYFYVRVKFE